MAFRQRLNFSTLHCYSNLLALVTPLLPESLHLCTAIFSVREKVAEFTIGYRTPTRNLKADARGCGSLLSGTRNCSALAFYPIAECIILTVVLNCGWLSAQLLVGGQFWPLDSDTDEYR